MKEENNSTVNETDISINDPIVFSSNATENGYVIQIVMKKGDYSFDALSGMKNCWKGNFYFRIFKEYEEENNMMYETPINIFSSDELTFNSSFTLILDDYNGDGDPDFTLGQWLTSNNSVYQIYSINSKGEIYSLPIDTQGGILTIADHSFSVQLKKTGDNSFQYEYYDQQKGENIKEIMEWSRDRFVRQ